MAFDKKNKTMPKEVWLIENENTGEYLHVYSTDFNSCTWGTSLEAKNYSSEQAAQAAIDQWQPAQREGIRPYHKPLVP